MSYPKPKASFENSELKERVRAFWQAHPCGTKFTEAEIGTREFFDRIAEHRYEKEWHIPEAAAFAATRGLRVLEIGCGIATDGAQFAKAGAIYTGIDLTDAAVDWLAVTSPHMVSTVTFESPMRRVWILLTNHSTWSTRMGYCITRLIFKQLSRKCIGC
jgi:2-polyprenyl-3-methyl-5-hydroxy-6-metoxy-1,4-benzoquinol methylase